MKKMLSSATAFFMFATQAAAAPMTLNTHDSDLRSTIMLVARAGKLNVSVDDSVKGNISITLSNVEPERILEIIAKTKNLNLLKDGEIYILNDAGNIPLMQSWILPVHYGDAENLRQAIIMSLDSDKETAPDKVVRKEDGSGYAVYDKDNKFSVDRAKREDRVFVSAEVNALVLFGTQAEYERAKKILESLDVELKQVSLEAKILAIDKNASKDLGVDWMWSSVPQYPEYKETHHNAEYDRWGNQIATEYFEEEYTRKATDNTGYGILRFGRGPEGIPFEWYYGAKLNALITNGKAKVLSRPNVTTIQGREAIINVGSSVPIPRVDVSNSITTTSIEYKDAGIILKYTPRINADGTITATIHTEVSTPQYVPDMKAYRFNTRSADTTVTVRDGEPMVIGGLIGAEEGKSISKIPFLGDLPILGALFKSHHNSKTESELMIFLTAKVLNGAE